MEPQQNNHATQRAGAHAHERATRDTTHDVEVTSTFQKRPAYHYIRKTDNLPRYDEIPDVPFTDIIAKVRLFNPTNSGTWWIAAYDPDTHIAWGVAEIFEREVGSFSMDELLEFRGRFNLPIERDLHYRPLSLSDILAGRR